MPALLPYFARVVYEVGHTRLKIWRVQVRYLPQGLTIGTMSILKVLSVKINTRTLTKVGTKKSSDGGSSNNRHFWQRVREAYGATLLRSWSQFGIRWFESTRCRYVMDLIHLGLR